MGARAPAVPVETITTGKNKRRIQAQVSNFYVYYLFLDYICHVLSYILSGKLHEISGIEAGLSSLKDTYVLSSPATMKLIKIYDSQLRSLKITLQLLSHCESYTVISHVYTIEQFKSFMSFH